MNKVKQEIVPELRFPTFEKSDNWENVKLIDVTDKNKKWSFTGGPFGSNLKSSDYVEEKEGIRIIQLQNIGDGEFKNDYKIYTSKEKADELLSCNIYPGDIIMSKMGDPVGRACLIPDYHNRYVMSSDGIRIAVDENKYDKYFIYLIINSKVFRTKVENSSTGSTRKRIGLIDLKKLTLTIPKDKDEQQKVANCLSSLDNLITAETEKLEHLKDHKKGLLQQLFPAKGKTKPQFRFSEFKNDGDWEERMLGKISKITTGRLDANAMVDNGKFRFYTCAKDFYYIDKYAFDTEALLISGNGANVGYIHYYKGKFNAYQRTYVLDDFDKNIIYIKYYLEYNLGNRISIEKKEGNTPYIVKSTLSEMVVFCPKNPKEQKKIANCFSSADDLIQAQKTKIKNLKNHKKGLLQQLFPNIL